MKTYIFLLTDALAILVISIRNIFRNNFSNGKGIPKLLTGVSSLLIFTFYILIFAGCGNTHSGTLKESKPVFLSWDNPEDLKPAVDGIMSEVYLYIRDEWKKPVFIELKQGRLLPKSSHHPSPGDVKKYEMITDFIISSLIKNRIEFVYYNYTNEKLKEIEDGVSDIVDEVNATPSGKLESPNLQLVFGVEPGGVRYVNKQNVLFCSLFVGVYAPVQPTLIFKTNKFLIIRQWVRPSF